MKSPHPIPDDIKKVAEAVHEHFKGVGKLTVEQLQSALIQAIACGDFQRHVQESSSPISIGELSQEIYQAITYIPFRRVAELEARIVELEANQYEN